jgi:LacI family transcriptional regulator
MTILCIITHWRVFAYQRKGVAVPEPLRVALLIECSRGYGRNLLAGISAYARAFGPWTFRHEERMLDEPLPAKLRQWRPQGIITRLENAKLARDVCRLQLPTVGVPHVKGMFGIPSVAGDQEAIVQLAIEHFIERRLDHFAFCGLPGVEFSENRRRHFTRLLAKRGYAAIVFEQAGVGRAGSLAKSEQEALRRDDELARWLQDLPKPVGLMACNDMRALQVLNACQEHGIVVPDEVAVIGVDNDALQCELCDPSLSSVDNNAQRIGYEAAALLDKMFHGGTPMPKLTKIEPVGVVARRSTTVLAVADQDVAEAVRQVRDRACDGLTPSQLAKRTAVSRSTLERWFLESLGHSVADEISRVKLDRVKELLTSSDLPLSEIAGLAGFAHSETMQRMFKNAVGQTPGRYRARRRSF